MEEAHDANTAFVLPKSTGLHCALLCIDVLLYFLYKCCFFPPEGAVEHCYVSIIHASFVPCFFLSLSPQIYQVQKVGLARFPSCLHAFFPPCESCYSFTTTQPFRWQKTSKILESNLGNPLKSGRCPAGCKFLCNSALPSHNLVGWTVKGSGGR